MTKPIELIKSHGEDGHSLYGYYLGTSYEGDESFFQHLLEDGDMSVKDIVNNVIANVNDAIIDYNERQAGAFEKGAIIRHGNGETALMKVDTCEKRDDGNHRYYGFHCMGGLCGAYHFDCKTATDDDFSIWEENDNWRS